MNLNKGKSLNRLLNKDPDERILSILTEIYDTYITNSTKPISLLHSEFTEFFKNERIISFRKKIPKSLNQKGDAILQQPQLWILFLFVLHLENKPFKDILLVFKEAVNEVKKKEILLIGLNTLLERFPEISITAEDESELNKLLGPKNNKGCKEVIAMSDCGQFFLVKLGIEQQKRLKAQSAIVPLKNNPWLEKQETLTVYPFAKLLTLSNYTYHPCP